MLAKGAEVMQSREAAWCGVIVLAVTLWGGGPGGVHPAGAADAASGTEPAARLLAAELPRDPYLQGPGTPPPSYRPRLTAPTVGSFVSIQANVDACGRNIPGDAANEPSIAVDPNAPNRMVIGWRQFDNVASDFRQNGWAYSHDGGRTWVFPGAVEPGQFRSDPVVAVDDNGTFYYMSLGVGTLSPPSGFFTELFRSTDGGVTWIGPTPAFGGDKEWMAIDRSGGPGNGHVYTNWSAADLVPSNHLSRSIDGGTSFQTPVPIPSAPAFGTMDVGPNGALYVTGVTSGVVSNFRVARSDDAQNPLVAPTFVVDTLVDLGGPLVFGGINPIGILGQPQVAVNPTNGHVYMLCSVDPPGSDPLDVRMARSVDGGLTWSASVRVNDDAPGTDAYQWFGTIAVAPNGRIDVIWNDTRNDASNPNPTTSELFYAFSHDGGATWSPNVAVSPAFAHGVGYPQQQKIGDYYTMVSDAVGAHVAYAATHNGEQDVYFLRLGDYDCNANGVGDALDIGLGASADCNGNDIPDECEIAAGAVSDTDHDGVPDVCQALALGATLDIKPGSCPNPLNPRSQGIVTVALVGAFGFDVEDVDQATLRLRRSDGRGGAALPLPGPRGPRSHLEDVATPFLGAPCDCHESGGDGIVDLVLKFRTEEVVAALGLTCEAHGAELELELVGELLDDTPFAARDCVRLVPVGTPASASHLKVAAPHPNPFNPRVTVRYELLADGTVSAAVFDLHGRQVRDLLQGEARESGAHRLVWDGKDDQGVSAASGVYWIRVRWRAALLATELEERSVRAVLVR